jgi:hypothetical protein
MNPGGKTGAALTDLIGKKASTSTTITNILRVLRRIFIFMIILIKQVIWESARKAKSFPDHKKNNLAKLKAVIVHDATKKKK